MDEFKNMMDSADSTDNIEDKIFIYSEIVSKTQTDKDFRKIVNVQEFIKISEKYKSVKEYPLKIAILGYKSDLVGHWDPFTCETGLPGSEECAVYASQELANKGYSVTLYMNPHPDSIWSSSFSNPKWVSEDTWYNDNNTENYDLVLTWRRYDPSAGRLRGKKVFFWSHDSPPYLQPGQCFPQFGRFDGICILSEHHRKQFNCWPGFNDIPYTICGNGIVPEQFNDPIKHTNPYSIGYFSNYSRGLIFLIILWPKIRELFPEATLSICYGRETWNTISHEQLQFIITKIGEYKNMGVTEHGKVGHQELASIMKQTSVWAYPCNTETETFCITATKCQASGCIPVTTRIGALNETVHPDAPHIDSINTSNGITLYFQLLIDTLNRIKESDSKDIILERQKYIEFAHKFSWEACVDKWIQLYNSIC